MNLPQVFRVACGSFPSWSRRFAECSGDYFPGRRLPEDRGKRKRIRSITMGLMGIFP